MRSIEVTEAKADSNSDLPEACAHYRHYLARHPNGRKKFLRAGVEVDRTTQMSKSRSTGAVALQASGAQSPPRRGAPYCGTFALNPCGAPRDFSFFERHEEMYGQLAGHGVNVFIPVGHDTYRASSDPTLRTISLSRMGRPRTSR